ncbi:MAG: 2,3-bisphosphoglycerate-independent phosphoglycerate mutase [Desulfotignum sp.]|nr:2,3-bisphosphoglycerate-independent phosphoglycerate mutase [Desulfotignum sp.]MCF8126170.1 2,3-bisphosphoglycerate-independent phosphoglycerate mutase [Desulfotignum sp.]
MTPEHHPVNILMILDGWGINKNYDGNAVAQAHTPFLDHLLENAPHCRLLCSGSAVGLPNGTMGNSEVGHMNIGAGRRVLQDLIRINTAIEDSTFFDNPVLKSAMDTVKTQNNTLHLMGLLSDGGVHSHISHLLALVDMARVCGVKTVYIHAILDGRDTSPKSGITYLARLTRHLNRHRFGTIKTIAGRYWTMDRDTRWDRIQKAYDLMTGAAGDRHTDPLAAVSQAYEKGQTDEFIFPIFIENPSGSDTGTITDGDGIIFFNFRADRAKEITRAFIEKKFSPFIRKNLPDLSCFVTMTRYDDTFDLPVAFSPQHLTNIFGKVLSDCGIPQLRMAETEKYAHVTYFFNGGDDTAFAGEERIMIPSPRDVATYDQKPEMSAVELAEQACGKIRSGRFRFIVLNFANMDMVGHTGVLAAAIKACETVDQCVKKVVEAIWETRGTAFITADHGNSEQMTAPDGSPHTAHTLNPVPFIIAGNGLPAMNLKDGILGDIAPTILRILKLNQPGEMTGTPMITD